jgi:peptidyl-prolyl cis-trans isomerase C
MIRVNDTEISEDTIGREMQYHPAESQDEAWRQAALSLVVRELLLQEADRLAIEAGEGEEGELQATADERRIHRLLAREITVPTPDHESCARFYEQNSDRFRSPDRFDVAHILLAAHPEDQPAREAARAKAKELLAILAEVPERFGPLAREHSACPSREEDGDLGWVIKGQTVPEFETFLFEGTPGTIIPVPVPTPFGFHVVHLKAREAGRKLDFEEAEDSIAAYLQESTWRRAVHQYISILAGKARIEGIEVNAAASPLVQ